MKKNRFISAINPPALLEQPAYWFAFSKGKLLVYEENTSPIVPVLLDFAELDLESVRQQYLGTLDGLACFSVELTSEATAPASMRFQDLRSLFVRTDYEFNMIAGRAFQIMNWDRNTQFCGRCGNRTESQVTERVKKCPICKLRAYPRLSPSMIVLISRGDEVLLARSPTWPPGMYSVLAGFVEAGEEIEEAIHREVWEEVRITVKNIRYFGSQPWPFPDSLMIAFTADYASGHIQPAEAEIEDARWFPYNNLPLIPPRISIARRLIDAFVKERMGE